MKRIAIFGSTGSVGTQSLSVVNQNQNKFEIISLSCNHNADLLFEQTKKFMPEKIGINKVISHHPLKDFCKKNNIDLSGVRKTKVFNLKYGKTKDGNLLDVTHSGY